MDATELGVLFAGISSILGVLIYFTKNIKQSSCCGNDCRQVVVDSNGNQIASSSRSVASISSETLERLRSSDNPKNTSII